MPIIALVLFCLFAFAGVSFAAGEVVDSSAVFRVDEIRYDIGDAFDDSKSHTKYDKWAYDFLNLIHIETQEATVRNLLLFNEGDYVDLNLMLEAERFLRDQNFLSDASISVAQDSGKNVVNVHTSDNWTLTLPFSIGMSGSEWTYDNLNYGIGIQESNFLGLGQKLGFYYGHDEFRDSWLLEYSAPHFLFRYNHFDVTYSYNTDGYLASWSMYIPYLSRSVNQWSYTLSGLKNKRYAHIYGSGDMPKGAVRTEWTHSLDSLQRYNGNDAVDLIGIDDFISDSLSFRIGHSFGGAFRKFYLSATYDYQRLTSSEGRVKRFKFTDGEDAYVIDESFEEDWLPERKDSRLGAYIKYSNYRYEKIRNFHNVKWTEDIEKGYALKFQISKNFTQLGSMDNDLRFDFWTELNLGRNYNHLKLCSRMNFYLDHGARRDFYGRINGEYIFHPSNFFSTAVTGLVDLYDNAKYGYQLSLGGADGFVGFPTGFYTGQARVYGSVEPRLFPNIEIATLMPVLVVFGSVGETAWNIKDINREDLIYVAGFGVRFAQTKSISRLINKLDVSFPLNGTRKGEAHYSLTATYSL